MLSKAIALAAKKFEGVKDKGGEAYILHCIRVMMSLNTKDEELNCIAILHDIIEDTDITVQDLKSIGFTDRVIEGVYTLTHLDIHSYDEYIRRIALIEDARKVKLADLKDNSDFTRLKGLTKKDFDRMEKYQKSYIYLSKV